VASDEMVGLSFSPSTDCLGVPSSGPSSLPSDVLSFLSGEWNTEDVVELGLSGTLSVALPSMTSSWEALALSNASALEESAFLIGCCGVWGWLGASAALPLPDPWVARFLGLLVRPPVPLPRAAFSRGLRNEKGSSRSESESD
jgi:hypothetical protein